MLEIQNGGYWDDKFLEINVKLFLLIFLVGGGGGA